MSFPYIQDDEDDASSVADSEKTITQHEEADDNASVVAPSIAYSTLIPAPDAQLGPGLFTASDTENDTDQDLREAVEDLDDGEGHDALVPNGFMPHLLDRSGLIVEYLTNKAYSTCHDDQETTVQKNLIVVLQTHVLFEDCLQKNEGETRSDMKKKEEKVYAAIQEAVGLPQKRKTDCRLVIYLLKTYSQAREQEILCFAIDMEEPPLPTTALNALLLMLMDRYIMFKRSRKSSDIRTTAASFSLEERLAERFNVMQHTIEDIKKNTRDEESRLIQSISDDNTECSVDKEAEPKLWTQFAPMVSSDKLNLTYLKPWFAEEWLSKHVPKESWPPIVKRVMVRQEDTAAPSQQSTKVDKPEPSSGHAQQVQSLAGLGKRKREEKDDEDEASGPESRRKGVVAEVEAKTSYYTIGNLVYRPKV